MKRGAFSAVRILLLASLAITVAAAQPAREWPADRVDPGELEDRTATPDPKPCSQSKRDEVLAPPPAPTYPPVRSGVDIQCNLTLKPTDVVTKTLIMAGQDASGITVDCNGATIRAVHEAIIVGSRQDESGVWRGAENITVRRCKVIGRVRVAGGLPDSSRRPNHTREIQARSPKNIVFDRLDIESNGPDPFYVHAGALRVTLMNSRIHGRTTGVPIYLDAESAEHVIRGNAIGVTTDGREQMSIDGSARNLIVGNRFAGLSNGGIFIYRNCGEKGTIRHQYPADNVILDNVFYYRKYSGSTPAVWIASRQHRRIGPIEDIWKDDQCIQDNNNKKVISDADLREHKRLGTSLFDNRDHAHRTVVAQNRFIGRDPDEKNFAGLTLIRVSDDPSYVFSNVRDDSARNRNSACYVANGYPTPIVAHGKSIAMFDDGSGPRCTGQRLTCSDGKLTPGPANCARELASRLSIVQFGCRAEGNNRGCDGRAVCPRGTSVVATKAACDLEYGPVTDEQLSKTPWSFAGVVRRSDSLVGSAGVCVVGGVDVSERGAVLGAPRAGQMPFSCREHDDNGGDCHIRGVLACAANPVFEE